MNWLIENIGTLATIGTTIFGIIIGGTISVQTIRHDIQSLSTRLQVLEQKTDKIQDLVVNHARLDERITSLDQRQLAQGARIDAILPLLLHAQAKEEDR